MFWTKDPLDMLGRLDTIDEMGYRYYFQFTLRPMTGPLKEDCATRKR